jgi:alpha-L-rhamnosidase
MQADVFDLTVDPTGPPSVNWPCAALSSRQRVWWRVWVGTASPDHGGCEAWSSPAFAEAPLWDVADWGAEGITHPAWLVPGAFAGGFPELERDFHVTGPVRSARLYLSAAGVVVPTINGVGAIGGQLEPGYSTLSRNVAASAWDVTSRIRRGHNVIGFALGGGIAFVPKVTGRYSKFTSTERALWVRARLELAYEDGSICAIATGPGWRARCGETTVAHWYGGQDSDPAARTEWTRAAVVDTTPLAIWWRAAPAIRVAEVLEAQHVERRPDGSRVIDFGTNVAGRPVLSVSHAEPGRPLVLRPGELLGPQGLPDQASTGAPIWDRYTPRARVASWTPELVYHGLRYLHVEGLADDEPDDAIHLEVLRASNERVGSFTSSDPFLSRLHRIIDRAVQSNMFSVFTDCPHREKLGWLEELHLCFETIARGYDVQAHMGDAVRHMLDGQSTGGLVTSHVPELIVLVPRLPADFTAARGAATAFRDDPNWGRAIVEVPWRSYTHYGDAALLHGAFPAMLRYLSYLDSRSSADLLDHGLGDWIEVDGTTPRSLVASHGWAASLDSAAAVARVLGRTSEAERLVARAESVWAAIRREFLNVATGVWGSGSQASWALAWSSRASRDEERAGLVQGLLRSIDDAAGAITVGEISLPSMIRCLTASGNGHILNAMIRRTDVAGYGHQIETDATSLTQSWHGPSRMGGVASQNHFMLGAIDEWITGDVAGLRQAPDSIGWEHVAVRPLFLDGVNDAATVFDSPRGRMSVGWRREVASGRITLDVELPPNVRSTIDVADTVDVRMPGSLGPA